MERAKWKWYGYSGHFIPGNECRFHLTTVVGSYLVSTVGQFPDPFDKDKFGRMGYGPEEFETYVFPFSGEHCTLADCGACGQPEPSSWTEIAGIRSMTAGEATKNHMEMCEKYAVL
jgi:hypothetical protein